MDIRELITLALNALQNNKLRTGLTMLGIVIGVAAVIIMLSIGSGSQASIVSSISSLGANTLTISGGASRTGLVSGGFGSAQTITNKDYKSIEDLKSTNDNISGISPEVSRNLQVVFGSNNTNVSVTGVVEDYLIVRNFTISSGTFINQEAQNKSSRIAVLGATTAQTLFGTDDPIGQRIKIDKTIFTVVGVLNAKGQTGFQNPDDIILVPLSTAQKILLGNQSIRNIVVSVKTSDMLSTIQAELENLLLTNHKINDISNADFTIRNSQETLSALTAATSTFTALLAGVASVSLLVGGIGIMNTMIITIAERTREIGLRKAIGAKDNTILNQFLVEAIVLTGSGGIIGVIVGIAVSLLIKVSSSINILISLESILLSLSVSVLVGLIFGIYPARQASKLSPIEALRYE